MREKEVRVLGYIRVSTEEQAVDGFSLENQEKDIKKYCEFMNYTLLDVIADEGISGSTLDQRPGIQEVLRRVEKEDIDYIIVWKVSRLSRKLSDVVKIVEILEDNKTFFYALKDGIDTASHMGKPFLMIASIFAEIERENLIVQVRGGMKEKATQGGWVGGKPPIGYKLKDEQLVVDEENADIIKEIFHLYISGNGYTAIAEVLNRKGYITREGRPFSVTSVKGILRNPTYAGKIRWGHLKEWGKRSKGQRTRQYDESPVFVDGIHEAIVSYEVYDKVQRMIDSNPRRHVKRFVGHHLLSGALRCPECGYGMSYHIIKKKTKDFEYYSCNQYSTKKTCRPNLIRKQVVEEDFMKKLISVVEREEFTKQLKSKLQNSKNRVADLDAQIIDLNKKKKSIQQKQSRVLDELLIEDKESLRKLLRDKLETLSVELTELEKRVSDVEYEKLDISASTLNVNELTEILTRAGKLLSIIEDAETKQKLVRKLVKEVKATKEGIVTEIIFSYGETVNFNDVEKGGHGIELSEVRRTVSQVTLYQRNVEFSILFKNDGIEVKL